MAIKKFSRPFQSTIHAKRTHRLVIYFSNLERKVFRELKLLRLLDHENVLEMIDVFTPDENAEELRDV